MKRWIGWMAVGLLGCGGADASDQDNAPAATEAPAAAPAPEARFAALESMLLGASAVEMDFEVIAEGAVEVAIAGRLLIAAEGRQSLVAEGTFAGAPADVMLEADAGELRWGSVSDPTEGAALPAVREALLVGLTRMGILHNVARLTAAAPPDHAEGGAAEWVIVDAFRSDASSGDGVAFDITVSGVPSGSATLVLDDDGYPAERRQTVAFPEGEMRVIERYSAVRIVP